MNAQGEDVVAGVRTPAPVAALHDVMPAAFNELMRIREVLAKMEDTQIALGSDVMVASSEGYALMKLFGKAEGLTELQDAMRLRRPGRPRKDDQTEG